MKCLTAEMLSQLDSVWREWTSQARTLKQRRIRLRLHFVYLLIRHGGLRLGEAIELDDRRDLVISTSTIRVGDRDIQISQQGIEALLRIVEDPALLELHGELTHVDPGYVRKKFYMVAESAGIGRTLAGPKVLRHSRGAELLNHGIPVSIVQKFLGLQSPVQAVQLKDFQDGEAKQILHAHLRRETLRHTSARNAFAGTITDIAENRTMAKIVLTTLSGLDIHATISLESMQSLHLHEGQTIMATVKAPWVIISPPGTKTSCANNFQGRVLFVREGDLEASVRLRLDDGTGMATLMTMDAIQRMNVRADMRCTVSFSAMSVVLNPS